jgi:hypothetical protein
MKMSFLESAVIASVHVLITFISTQFVGKLLASICLAIDSWKSSRTAHLEVFNLLEEASGAQRCIIDLDHSKTDKMLARRCVATGVFSARNWPECLFGMNFQLRFQSSRIAKCRSRFSRLEASGGQREVAC